MNPLGYNGHSFCKGTAHAAAAMSSEDIKVLGRSKSDAYKLYTGHDDVRRLHLAMQVNTKLQPSAPRPQ